MEGLRAKRVHSQSLVRLLKKIRPFLTDDIEINTIIGIEEQRLTDIEAEIKHLEQQTSLSAGTEINMRQITLANIHLWKDEVNGTKCVWNFEDKAWTPWEPVTQRNSMRRLVTKILQKIAKVAYFVKHTCSSDDWKVYLPEALVFAVIIAKDVEAIMRQETRHYHERVLGTNMTEQILPHWRAHTDYPTEAYDEDSDTAQKGVARMDFWGERAVADNNWALNRFFSPLNESVDLEQIARRYTKNDTDSFNWALKCIVMMAEGLHRSTAKQLTRNTMSKQRNAAWVLMATEKEDNKASDISEMITFAFRTSPPAIDCVTLQYHFGCGQRSSRRKPAREEDEGSEEFPRVPNESDLPVLGWSAPETKVEKTVVVKERKRKVDLDCSEAELERRKIRRKERINPTGLALLSFEKE